MYERMAKELLKVDYIGDDSFEGSYQYMYRIEKLLYSKRGIKKGIVSFLFKNTTFNTMMHPLTVKDAAEIDYLNLKKNEWKDPSTENISNTSFYELLDEASIDAREWIKLVVQSYEGREVNISMFTKGFIYDGYIEGNKMKVFEDVYKKEEKSK